MWFQVLAYEANIEAAVLAQDSGKVPLPEDYTHFIPKVGDLGVYQDCGWQTILVVDRRLDISWLGVTGCCGP